MEMNEMRDDCLNIVKERVNLKESRNVLEKILSNIYIKGNMSTKELARECALPIPVVTAIKKEFIRLNILEQNNGVQLTKYGREYVEGELGYYGLNIELYKLLIYNEVNRNSMIDNLTEKYMSIFDNRPQVDVTIDQAKGTTKTAFKRAMLCLEQQTLLGKCILCVGDDDLVSVAIGLLLGELYDDLDDVKQQICVFDIDERYINYINQLAMEYHLPIECLKINLREPLPMKYVNRFDCFFTDPPYTTDGMALFLSRGISALKQEKGLQVFLSYGQKPIDEMKKVEEVILEHGLVITNIYKSFNEYEGASFLANVSQMIVLQSSENVKMLIPQKQRYLQKIYTGEFKDKDSRYKCKTCKKMFKLSRHGKFQTIEQLKSEGCPYCGNNVFVLQKKNAPAAIDEKKKCLGVHILVDFYGCNQNVLKDTELIEKYMHEAAKRANANIVSEKFHSFSPWGVSGVVIIKESHLTIHTWPEYKYAAVDLFTCGSSLDLQSAMEYLVGKLECEKMEMNDIFRGSLEL